MDDVLTAEELTKALATYNLLRQAREYLRACEVGNESEMLAEGMVIRLFRLAVAGDVQAARLLLELAGWLPGDLIEGGADGETA